MQPEQSARQDDEYVRHGTANLFLSIEPLQGQRQVRVREQRTVHDFAEVVRAIVDEDYPDAETIVLVVDNLNTHSPAALYEHFPAVEARRIAAKLEWHFTPEHGSWLNIAECELSFFPVNVCSGGYQIPRSWLPKSRLGHNGATTLMSLSIGTSPPTMRVSN